VTSLGDEIIDRFSELMAHTWETRDGRVVPDTTTVGGNQAVKLNATYLYADMAGSTGLAQRCDPELAARVMRSYLDMAVRVIRYNDGQVRSFDGDRVMAIFVGDEKESRAGKAALGIEWWRRMMSDILGDHVESLRKIGWRLKHGVGLDTGEALLVRAGIRGNNDLISIGRAPNVAAKLSALREGYSIYATKETYFPMDAESSYVKDDFKESMWDCLGNRDFGGRTVTVYGSAWGWRY
jgi:adenylate cyclase